MARRKDINKPAGPAPELVDQLNSRITKGNAKFLEATKTKDGKYELTVQTSEETIDALFFPTDQKETFRSRIKPINNSNTLMGKLQAEKELFNLNEKLEALREKARVETSTKGIETAKLNTQYRDALDSSYLDLRGKPSDELAALKLYTRSNEEYYRTGIYGTQIDVLSNFSATGFYNEINDQEVKEFYDAWTRDTGFTGVVSKIFNDLFKYSVCYILNAKGPYEAHPDGISSIPGRAPSNTKAGKKAQLAHLIKERIRAELGKDLDYSKFSTKYKSLTSETAAAGGYPIAYTLLPPEEIRLDSSGFFGGTSLTITKKGLLPLKKILEKIKSDPSKVSKSVKDSLTNIPSGMKTAAQSNQEYTFKDEEVSVIFLRKRDSDIYAKPRASRAFDAFDYRDELKKADYATIDGITNYILKVTVGDAERPIQDEKVLADLAEAFNTPQKAFTVVWNDTLKIEKITSAGDVGEILGKAKYEPVDDEITNSLGFSRVLIDGAGLSGDGGVLVTKSLKSEITAARIKVEDWVYSQYRELAKLAGFNSYPVVRWKESVISTDSDAVTRASFMQMLDRKAISVQSYMREMDFDYDTELQRLREELPLIQEDVLRAGSPYNQVATSPSGDSGRPVGQPPLAQKPIDSVKVVKDTTKVKAPSKASLGVDELIDILRSLDPVSLTELKERLSIKADKSTIEEGTEVDISKSTLDEILD